MSALRSRIHLHKTPGASASQKDLLDCLPAEPAIHIQSARKHKSSGNVERASHYFELAIGQLSRLPSNQRNYFTRVCLSMCFYELAQINKDLNEWKLANSHYKSAFTVISFVGEHKGYERSHKKLEADILQGLIQTKQYEKALSYTNVTSRVNNRHSAAITTATRLHLSLTKRHGDIEQTTKQVAKEAAGVAAKKAAAKEAAAKEAAAKKAAAKEAAVRHIVVKNEEKHEAKAQAKKVIQPKSRDSLIVSAFFYTISLFTFESPFTSDPSENNPGRKDHFRPIM